MEFPLNKWRALLCRLIVRGSGHVPTFGSTINLFTHNTLFPMKKITIALGVFLISSVATFAQVKVGLTGGVQLASQKNDFNSGSSSGSINGSERIGFMAGLILDAAFSESFSIRPQILYSVKGTKYTAAQLGATGAEATATVNYVEVPVQLVYGLSAGPGKVVLGAGPYAAYALNGKLKGSFQGQTEEESIEFGSGQDQWKQLDYGVRVSAGYELTAGLLLNGYYSLGLANLSNDATTTTKNTAYGLSLGFLFGGR